MDFNSCQPRLPDHLTHPGAATSLSFTSMETPNLSLSSCNSLLLAVKNTLGQPQFLPPAPHLQFCLENSAPGTSPIVFVCAGANWEVSASGGLWRCLLVPQPAIFKCEYKVLPPHAPSRDFFFSSPFQVHKTDEGAANWGLPGPISRDLGSIQTLLGVTEKPRISSCPPLPSPSISQRRQRAQVELWVPKKSFVYPAVAQPLTVPLHPNKSRMQSHAGPRAAMTLSPGKALPGVAPRHCRLPGMCFAFLCLCKTRGGGGEGEPALPAPAAGRRVKGRNLVFLELCIQKDVGLE